MTQPLAAAGAALLVLLVATLVAAHDGPPFPIVSDRAAGPYRVSIWTDPDATDDGAAGGQFWVRLDTVNDTPIPEQTRARIAIRPLDREGPALTRTADPVSGTVTNQFAALVMDHEGRFAVHVTVDGPLGAASVEAEVSATYDLRPEPILLFVYLVPFVLVGLLWGRLLARRRALARGRARPVA